MVVILDTQLLLAGATFGIAAGGADGFVSLVFLIALVGMGIGGRPDFPY